MTEPKFTFKPDKTGRIVKYIMVNAENGDYY